MKKIALTLCLLSPFALPAPALAELGIVATVNDEAITNTDLDGRMRLALLGSGMKASAETQARLRDQVLRTLVDERLQTQEAKRLGITVEEKDIDTEVARLAQQNGQTAQSLPLFFARNGVPISALRDQLRAGIAWAMAVQRKLRPQVNITDSEIEAEAARLQSAAGQPEYLSAEIFLPVPSPTQDAKVHQTAIKLIEQMAHGARFSSVARQFSQTPSAARGGDLGWVRAGQLEPEVDAALRALTPGTLSLPVKTSTGYYIVMLREQRMSKAPGGTENATQVDFNLRQVLLPVEKNAAQPAIDSATRKLEELRASAKTCADMERIAGELGDSNRGNLGKVKYAELPAALQPVLATLPDSTASTPMRNDRGLLFLMVCDRVATGTVSDAEREEINQRLGAQRLDMLARRYLRDLRQDSFVDIRG